MVAQGEEGVQRTYTVPYDSFGVVQDKVADINRRAKKLGLNLKPFEVVVLDDNAKYPIDSGPPYYNKLYDIRGVEFYFQGDIVKLPGGWRVIAVKKHDPEMDRPLVTRTSEDELPKKFYALGPECQHCKLSRPRTTTIVLKNDNGEIIQVGKSCLKDFLGDYPEGAIDYACKLALLDEWMGRGWDDLKDPKASSVDMLYFLSLAVYFVQRDGYVKANATDAMGRPLLSTVDTIMDYLASLKQRGAKLVDDTPEMRERAKTVLDWARATAHATTGNDYWWNVGAALSIDWVTPKTRGIVASTVAAYARYLEKKTKAEATQKSGSNEWVGAVGDRLQGLKLTLVRKIVSDGMYGTTYILKFLDDDGHAFTWFSSRGVDADGEIWGEGGEVYFGVGTVKKHDEYRGEKQTVLTRATLSRKQSTEAVKKPRKKSSTAEKKPRKKTKPETYVHPADIDARARAGEPAIDIFSTTNLDMPTISKLDRRTLRYLRTVKDDPHARMMDSKEREAYAAVEAELDERVLGGKFAVGSARELSRVLNMEDASTYAKYEVLVSSIRLAWPSKVFEYLTQAERASLRDIVMSTPVPSDDKHDLSEALLRWREVLEGDNLGMYKIKARLDT